MLRVPAPWISTEDGLPPLRFVQGSLSINVLGLIEHEGVSEAGEEKRVAYLRYNRQLKRWESGQDGWALSNSDRVLAWQELPQVPANEAQALEAGWFDPGDRLPKIEDVQNAPFSKALLVVFNEDVLIEEPIVTMAHFNHRHLIWMALDRERLLSVWGDVLYWRALPCVPQLVYSR